MGRAEQLLKGLHRNWKLQMPEGFQLPAQDLCPLHQPTAATQRALWGTATPARKAACLGSLSLWDVDAWEPPKSRKYAWKSAVSLGFLTHPTLPFPSSFI